MLTGEQQVHWQYLEEESNELLLRVLQDVEKDGFAGVLVREDVAVETLTLKLVSMTMVKCLALLMEKLGHDNLPMAYMQATTMHVELVKYYMMKQSERTRA